MAPAASSPAPPCAASLPSDLITPDISTLTFLWKFTLLGNTANIRAKNNLVEPHDPLLCQILTPHLGPGFPSF